MPVAWEVAMVQLVVTVTVRDLTHEDLPACAWSGTVMHIASVARELDRAQRGEVDYLAVCPPSNLPVAIGEVDYQACPGAVMLSQLAVQAAWQSCGLGTILVRAAEQRILARGLDRAELGVEVNNPRARSLYERLGYVAYSRRRRRRRRARPGGWPAARPGEAASDRRWRAAAAGSSRAPSRGAASARWTAAARSRRRPASRRSRPRRRRPARGGRPRAAHAWRRAPSGPRPRRPRPGRAGAPAVRAWRRGRSPG